MTLPKSFPTSPHAILDPARRWSPADNNLMPPLVQQLRLKVQAFRNRGYEGASDTSKSLLNWWFNEPHLQDQSDGTSAQFQYFFAQREALETIIYLYEVVKAQDKFDLMRFDASGAVSAKMFPEDWRRYVVKMATGSGKTKVMSLALAWSFFHKTYEPESDLARNFLVIAPNIIVLDRLYKDFQGLRIFFQDPVLPHNGFAGRNWRDDFQLTLHRQDEVRVTQPHGNIFLTNIHRVYSGNELPPSPDDDNSMDYFLGKHPSGATTDSKVDLGDIVRDIDELMVLNDEAHHIHDANQAWFKSIADIHHRLLHKGATLSLQLDVTATPRHNNGAIFVQTIADYPLVEAISQNVVKHPVLPDDASRAQLQEKQSIKFTEQYADYLHLGVVEWRKAYAEHEKMGQKAILFVMTDDTKNCDEVAAYLEGHYPDLQHAVLTIHTKNNGEISEPQSGKKKEELERLRQQANTIDAMDNPYKAIVSVLMLKEGWDVRNVTTIVGLRAYSAKSNILPEQTLGRGLRRMYGGDAEEYLSVIGTNAFIEFVDSIKADGVVLERQEMGETTPPKTSLMIEVDQGNPHKDIDALDIAMPLLTPRLYREYNHLAALDASKVAFKPVIYQQFSDEEQRKIVFRDVTTGEITHTTELDGAGLADYRSVIGYFTHTIIKALRLVSGYDVLYGQVKDFVTHHLFGEPVALETANTLRNLSELAATKTVMETFKQAINHLIVKDKGGVQIQDAIKLKQTRPFVVKRQDCLIPTKSVFNRIIGDSRFELEFASFLEGCRDVKSFAKNYLAVHFTLDYVNANGDLVNYYPDFLVKLSDDKVIVVETKGREDLDVPRKMARLHQWCEDVNAAQNATAYDFVYANQVDYQQYRPTSFQALLDGFRAYKDSCSLC